MLRQEDLARIAATSGQPTSSSGDQGVAFIVAAAGAVPGGPGTVGLRCPTAHGPI